MKKLTALPMVLLLSACMGSNLTPEQQASLERNIENNRVDPANAVTVQSGGSQLRINVNNSRTVAMVQGVPGQTNILQMESAVSQQTGCRSEAPTNITELLGASKSAPLSDRHYMRFGGAIPIRILC